MQAFSTLVTLAPIHNFIFKKQPMIEPCKTLLKQNTQKKEGEKRTNKQQGNKRNNQPLALDNDHLEIMLHNHIEKIVV
jgi:hypothetical protein